MTVSRFVEVVGDSGREAADGLHLLRLLQVSLEGALLRHVLGGSSRSPSRRLLALHHAPESRTMMRWPSWRFHWTSVPVIRSSRSPAQDDAGALPRIHVHVAVELERPDLALGLVAEHGDEGGIDLQEPTFEGSDAIDAVGRLLDDGAVVGAERRRARRVAARPVSSTTMAPMPPAPPFRSLFLRRGVPASGNREARQ